MAALDPADVLIELWSDAGLDDEALENVAFTGSEPVLPSSFAVGTAAQAAVGAAALAAAELWRLRSGRRQRVTVEMRDAAIELRSERYLRVEGKAPNDHHDEIAGLYRCGDGRWARLHTNLPHHRDGLLQLLGCDHDKAAVQRALERWPARRSKVPQPRPVSWSPRAGPSPNGMRMRRAARLRACPCSALNKSARRRP
jgi:hypothetical protein